MKIDKLENKLIHGSDEYLYNHLHINRWKVKEIIDNLIEDKTIENFDYSKYKNIELIKLFREKIINYIIEEYECA